MTSFPGVEWAAKTAYEMELFPYYLYRQKNIAGNFENVGYAKVDKAGYTIYLLWKKNSLLLRQAQVRRPRLYCQSGSCTG